VIVVLFNQARHPQGLYSAVETGRTFFSLQNQIPETKEIMGLFNEESSWSPDEKHRSPESTLIIGAQKLFTYRQTQSGDRRGNFPEAVGSVWSACVLGPALVDQTASPD
jgi:hypothetical protein